MKEHLFVRNKYQWSCAVALQEERTKSYRTQIKMDKNKGFIKVIVCCQKKNNGYVTSTFHICQCCLIYMNNKRPSFYTVQKFSYSGNIK